MKVSNVKTWLASEYASVSDDTMVDMLYTPESAIEILAKCIKHFNELAPSKNYIEQFNQATTLRRKAEVSGKMSCLKDGANISYVKGGYWEKFGAQSYEMAITLAPELLVPNWSDELYLPE